MQTASSLARHQTAAALLGATVHALLPKAQLLGMHATEVLFSYDIICEGPLDPSLLPSFEQELIQRLRSDLAIRTVEMVPASAAAYYRSRGQQLLAERILREKDPLLSLLQIGDWLELCPLPHLERLRDIGLVRLYEVTEQTLRQPNGQELRITRLSGIAAANTQQLKQLQQRVKKAQEHDPTVLAKQLGLFEESRGERYWLPKGEQLRQLLIDWWRTLQSAQGVACIKTPRATPADQAHLVASMPSLHAVAELSEKKGTCSDLTSLFCPPDQLETLLPPLLQFLLKTATICLCDYRVFLQLPRKPRTGHPPCAELLRQALRRESVIFVEDRQDLDDDEAQVTLRLLDALGHSWPGPQLGIRFTGLTVFLQVYFQLFPSLERMVVLLLEQCGGLLPLWLAPEQVRLLPTQPALHAYAHEVQKACAQHGLRTWCDERPLPLNARIFEAESAKIPYMLVLGPEEERTQTVAVRSSLEQPQVIPRSLADFLQQTAPQAPSFTFLPWRPIES